MSLKTLPLLLCTLLALPSLSATARGQEQPVTSEQAPGESLGSFFRRLTTARPEQVAALLDSMPDINAATEGDRVTAMHAAIAFERPDILLLLLQRGANTELLMKPGLTPLSAAAMKNDTDAISLLLRHGAELNHETAGGVSALKLACAKGNLDAAQVLLAHGADATTADSEGHTALTLAQEHAGADRLPLMRMLLEHGASPNVQSEEDYHSPLMAALIEHDIPAAELLLQHGAACEAAHSEGHYTPLMLAAAFGYTSLVQQLLDCGAQTGPADNDGNDALDYAVCGALHSHNFIATLYGEKPGLRNPQAVDSVATCRLLLQHGASVRHVDKEGNTPLILAARAGETDIVSLLLEHGADVNAQNQQGHTALISALLPAAERMQLALPQGSDAEDSSRRADFLFIFERSPQHLRTAQLLLRAGAATDVQDASGHSALDYADTPEWRALLMPEPDSPEPAGR